MTTSPLETSLLWFIFYILFAKMASFELCHVFIICSFVGIKHCWLTGCIKLVYYMLQFISFIWLTSSFILFKMSSLKNLRKSNSCYHISYAITINIISGVSPLITRVITHLLSGMNHQVDHSFIGGIFHYKPTSFWDTPMTMETSICCKVAVATICNFSIYA